MSLEDKWFIDGRIVKDSEEEIELSVIQEDFERFVGYKLSTPQAMGHILKKNGYVTKATNGKTVLKGYAMTTASTDKNQERIA